MVDSGERLTSEQLSAQPEVCPASLEAAISIARPLAMELADRDSVPYTVASARIAGLPADERLGIAPLLLTDPSRSGVVVERWRLQGGELPADATSDNDPEKMVALWASKTANMPPLRVPEGADGAVMDLADRLQMRGGGPVVFAREEAADMDHRPKTLLHVVGGANKANKERLESALAYAEKHGLEGPIVATVNPLRVLRDKERDVVKEFAPEAENELELHVDSGVALGFTPQEGNRYGVRFLPDGSSYLTMRHPNGASLLVIAPLQHIAKDGTTRQTGVFNAYHALAQHPEVVSDDFQLEGSNIVQVTSSHYGPMAAMNNLRAIDDLRTSVASFRVIGDNQPATRKPQAHLIEIGMTTNALDQAMRNPRLAAGLQAAFPQS